MKKSIVAIAFAIAFAIVFTVVFALVFANFANAAPLSEVLQKYRELHSPPMEYFYGTDENPTSLGKIERERLNEEFENSIRELENSIRNLPPPRAME